MENTVNDLEKYSELNLKNKHSHRQAFQGNPPKTNELFYPGRMAYVIDLEDEFAESDIPTTTIRLVILLHILGIILLYCL